MPADADLVAMAPDIEISVRHQLAEDPAGEDSEFPGPVGEEPDGGEISERDGAGFTPLSANVRPVETMMAGLRFADPEMAAAIDTIKRRGTLGISEIVERLGLAEPAGPGEPIPEFERRETLRRERHRLVGLLHYQTGREFQDIQLWLNEAVAGGRPVAEHTLHELQAAVALLSRAISDRER